jgi:hypothetical protein
VTSPPLDSGPGLLRDFEADVIPYVLGDLPPTEQARFEDALAASPALREEVEAVRATFGTLRESLPPQTPPDGLRNRVVPAATAQPQPPILKPSIRELAHVVGPRRRKRVTLFSLAIVASIGLAVTVAVLQLPGERVTPEQPVLDVRTRVGNVVIGPLPIDGDGAAAAVDAGPANRIMVNRRLRTGEDATLTATGPDVELRLGPETIVDVLPPAVEADGFRLRLRTGSLRVDRSADGDSTTRSPSIGVLEIATPHGLLRGRDMLAEIAVTAADAGDSAARHRRRPHRRGRDRAAVGRPRDAGAVRADRPPRCDRRRAARDRPHGARGPARIAAQHGRG